MKAKKARKALITAISIMLGLVVAGGCIVGAGYGTSKSWNMSDWFQKSVDAGSDGIDNPPRDYTPDEQTENPHTGVSVNSVIALPQKLYFGAEALAAADGSDVVESITVRATVYPEEAADKRVDWNIAWVSDTSENIDNYFVITTSEDGSNVAVVGCKKAFGDLVARITVTTRRGLFKSYCTVRYNATATSFSITVPEGITAVTENYNPDNPLASGTSTRTVYELAPSANASYIFDLKAQDNYGSSAPATYRIVTEGIGTFNASLYRYDYRTYDAVIDGTPDSTTVVQTQSIGLFDTVTSVFAPPADVNLVSTAATSFGAKMGTFAINGSRDLEITPNRVLSNTAIYYGPGTPPTDWTLRGYEVKYNEGLAGNTYRPFFKVTITLGNNGVDTDEEKTIYVRFSSDVTGVSVDNPTIIF